MRSSIYTKFGIFIGIAIVFASFQNFTPLDPLPKSIPKYSDFKKDCFLEGELENRRVKLQRVEVQGCSESVVVPPEALDLMGPYEKGKGTIFSCQNIRHDTFSLLALTTGFEELLALSNALAKKPSDTAMVQCLTNTLHLWALNKALTKDSSVDSQNDYNRSWTMGSIASAYLKSPAVASLARKEKKEKAILGWFSTQADNILNYKIEVRQNLYFWRGFALTALGIATEDLEAIQEGYKIETFAIEQIQGHESDVSAKGWLPDELNRGQKAHEYHQFALQPILGMMNLSKAINCGFVKTERQEVKISALIRKLIEGYQDHSVFDEKAGVKQFAYSPIEGLLPLLGTDAQGTRIIKRVETYLAKLGMKLEARKPLNAKNLGGNVDSMPKPGSITPVSSAILKFCN